MKKSLLVLLSGFLSLILFSCATSTGDKPRAEIGGEITLVGTTPGLEMEIKIPFDSEKKDETTVEPTEEAETTPIIEVEEPYTDAIDLTEEPKEDEKYKDTYIYKGHEVKAKFYPRKHLSYYNCDNEYIEVDNGLYEIPYSEVKRVNKESKGKYIRAVEVW